MKKIKKVSLAFLLFVVYVIISIFLEIMFKVCLNSTNLWISSFCQILENLFVLLVISIPFVPTLIDNFKNFKKDNLKNAYKNWFWGLLIMYISNIIIITITKGIASNESYNRDILFQSPIFAITVMVFIAPMIEELIFRLSLKDIFKNKWIYATVSGLIFGLMHMTTITRPIELLYTISYGSLGFFFAKSVYETDNIFSSIIAHMTHNGLIITILLLSKYLGV